MKRLLLIITFLFFAAKIYAASLAVIPYKCSDSTGDDERALSSSYSRMVGLTSAIEMRMSLRSFRDVNAQLKKIGVDPDVTVTLEDLVLISKIKSAEYLITGTILKDERGFRSSSILYSKDRKKIVARSRASGDTLQELALNDARELFTFMIPERKRMSERVDAAILLDVSYNMSREWGDAKSGILSFSSSIMDIWSGSRVFIIPYSDGRKLYALPEECASPLAVRNTLEEINLKGRNSGRSYAAALQFSIDNIPWDEDSRRVILTVTNSELKSSVSLDRYSVKAKRKKIDLYNLLLGNIGNNESVQYSRLGGELATFNAAYRQVATDIHGGKFNLYFERGRLFEGALDTSKWLNGLFDYSDRRKYGYVKPPGFADEIDAPGKYNLTPYNMAERYKLFGERGILHKRKLESNVADLFDKAAENFAEKNSKLIRKKPLGRVLLQSGDIAIWTDVTRNGDMKFFQNMMKKGFVFPLGVKVRMERDEAYGFSFNPECYLFSYSFEDIPGEARVPLKDMVSDPYRYSASGLSSKSLWWVNVKVSECRSLKRNDDVRSSDIR